MFIVSLQKHTTFKAPSLFYQGVVLDVIKCDL